MSKFKAVGLLVVFVACFILFASCSSDEGGGSSYNFSASASASFDFASRRSEPSKRSTGPTLCSSVECVTPSVLTGRYYATGLQIQSSGNGMMAYFGQEPWSDITSSSDTFAFDSASPITNSGTLTCCGGTGDLSSSNTYISEIAYLFAYLDATFTISGSSNNHMNITTHNVRFILADGAVTGAVRGDLMYKDPGDSTWKWMDTSVSAGGNVGNGTLVTSRPATPVKMNTSVVSWVNPFGTTEGSQNIPTIYTGIITNGDGVYTITQADLEASGKTYSYAFDPTNFIMFPEVLDGEMTGVNSYYDLLTKIHLGGLPHSAQSMGVGNPSSTELVVTSR